MNTNTQALKQHARKQKAKSIINASCIHPKRPTLHEKHMKTKSTREDTFRKSKQQGQHLHTTCQRDKTARARKVQKTQIIRAREKDIRTYTHTQEHT